MTNSGAGRGTWAPSRAASGHPSPGENGERLRFHDLRHQAITELAEAGVSDATLMALAGHMSREMLEHYSHVRLAAKRAAIDMLAGGLMKPPSVEQRPASDAVQ